MDNNKKFARGTATPPLDTLTANEDRRDFSRKRTHGNVLLRVKTPPGTIFDAKLVDVSASGINITLNEPIVVGTEIQLAVKFLDHDEHFFVSGVVTRAAANDPAQTDDQFQLGVELRYEKNNPDFHDWRALFIS